MGELLSALDALAADDLHALFGPGLLDRVTALLVRPQPGRGRADPHGARGRGDAGRRARRAEVNMASWLCGHAAPAPGARHRRLVAGRRALERLPAVAAAFAAGRSPPSRWL